MKSIQPYLGDIRSPEYTQNFSEIDAKYRDILGVAIIRLPNGAWLTDGQKKILVQPSPLAILDLLLYNSPNTVEIDEIISILEFTSIKSLRVYMNRIRSDLSNFYSRKVVDNVIVTVRGTGYAFICEES